MSDQARFKRLVLAGSLALSIAASAHEPEKAAAPPRVENGPTTTQDYAQDVAPAAADAVKVVDAFSAAIKAAKLDEVGKLLDPKVLILESGSSERSRDEYLSEHAIADAAFMQAAQQQLRYRQAQIEGDVAWVCTESMLHSMKDGQMVMLLSTETMVLRKTEQGWKIVHIHWSSRAAAGDGEY